MPAETAAEKAMVRTSTLPPQVDPAAHGLDSSALPPEGSENRFGFFAVVGLSYAILNSWPAMTGSLSVVLPSGGPTSVIYGLLTSFIGVMAMALSLAEITHLLPLSGGVYHWTFLLAPPKHALWLSYVTAWLNCAAWWAVTATASSIFAQLITGVISLLHPEYTTASWQIFVIYVVQALGAWAVNVFGVRLLDGVNRAALLWSLMGALVVIITCLARSSGQYQPAEFVFANYVNETGWNDGVAWILGLLQSAFGLTAIDGVTHMVEEMNNPQVQAPIAMILAVAIGASSSLIVLIVFLFTLTDLDEVISSSAGAILTILDQATKNRAAAVSLLMFPVVSMCFAAISILTAASRQTQALARDRGLPFWKVWEKQNPTLGVPVYSISLTTFFVIIFGCIYLGSTSALNAILSSSVVNFQVSYCIPVLIIMFRGRRVLDELAHGEKRRFNLGRLGYPINTVAVVFNLFTAVFFFFPPELPVTGANMNYVIAVEAVVLVVAVLTWVFDSRKTFKGPLDIDRLLARFASHYVIAPPLSMPRSRSASTSSRINSPAHIPEPQPDLKT